MGKLVFKTPHNTDKGITSQYGMRTNPLNTTEEKFHHGTDYKLKFQEVVASERGVVIRAAESGVLGHTIIIDHTPWAKDDERHIYTQYIHLSEYEITVGDFVEKDQLIAISGNTGTATTAAHLHFAIFDSDEKLPWHKTGGTNVQPTTGITVNPETTIGQNITVDGTVNEFRKRDLKRLVSTMTFGFKAKAEPTITIDFKNPSYSFGADTKVHLHLLGHTILNISKHHIHRATIDIEFNSFLDKTVLALFPFDLELNGVNLGKLTKDKKSVEMEVWEQM